MFFFLFFLNKLKETLLSKALTCIKFFLYKFYLGAILFCYMTGENPVS